jgi:peptide/nickel transport system permease protein
VRSSRYVLKKISWSLFTILFVIVLNFFLFRILPGDPARAGIRDPRLTREAIEAIQVRFGLDKQLINCFESLNPIKLGNCAVNPFDTQFFIYVGNLLRGDLGISYHTNRPVADVLGERLGNTVLLIGAGQILAIVVGMALGLLAAWKSRTAIDFAATLGSLFAWSLPIVYMGEYMLFMRSTGLDVLSEDYILTAKAKGLSTSQILRKHALRNAMLPMVTLIALNLGFTVAGAIQIETVFSWPGLGLTITEAVGRRDFPMLQGAFLLIAVSVILANLIADLLYSVLDPRVQAS